MGEIEHGLKLLFLALVWSFFSSPFLFAAILMAKFMKRRGLTSPSAAVSFGLVVAALLAPVPTPIITVFYPNGLVLIQGVYYARMLGNDGFYSQLWPWVLTSIAATAIVCIAISLRFFSAPSNPNSVPRPPSVA